MTDLAMNHAMKMIREQQDARVYNEIRAQKWITIVVNVLFLVIFVWYISDSWTTQKERHQEALGAIRSIGLTDSMTVGDARARPVLSELKALGSIDPKWYHPKDSAIDTVGIPGWMILMNTVLDDSAYIRFRDSSLQAYFNAIWDLPVDEFFALPGLNPDTAFAGRAPGVDFIIPSTDSADTLADSVWDEDSAVGWWHGFLDQAKVWFGFAPPAPVVEMMPWENTPLEKRFRKFEQGMTIMPGETVEVEIIFSPPILLGKFPRMLTTDEIDAMRAAEKQRFIDSVAGSNWIH